MFQKILTNSLYFSLKKPGTVLSAYALLLLYCVYILASGLTLKSSNLDLLPSDAKEVQTFERLVKQYGTPNNILIVVESRSSDIRRVTCDKLEKDLLQIESIGGVVYKSFLPDEMLIENDISKYIESKDYQVLLVQPNDTRSNIDELIPLIYQVEKVVDKYRTDGLTFHLTGLPIFSKDDQNTVLTELPILGLISLGLIFIFMFQILTNYVFVILGFVSLVVSCILSLSLTSVIPGHLNLLSSAFIAISFGLNVDYLIHFVYGFKEDIKWINRQSLQDTMLKVLPSMSSSCLSTAGVFFIISFSEFKGFAELGLTAGSSLMIGLFVYYSFFPALLLSCKRKIRTPQAKVLSLFFVGKKRFAIATLLISIALCFVAKFQFDGNYLNLQPIQSETAKWEKRLSTDGLYSSNTYLMEIQGAEKAFELSEKLRELKEVEKVQSIVEIESFLETENRLDLLDEKIKKKFKGQDDNYLIYILPSIDLWSDEVAQKLNIKMRKLHEEVTGLPILAELITHLSIKSLQDSFYISILFLFILLLFRFKDIRLSLIAIFPSILTSISLLGVLVVFSYKLNSISMIALPLILGLALDDGIYLCHSMAQSYKERARTNSAIIFTSVTTILSFGCLIITNHRGIASFGFNIVVGVFLAMLYSLVIIPLLYGIFVKHSKRC